MSAALPPLNFSFGPHAPADILDFIERGPDASELAAAPLLEVWQPILTPSHELRLFGLLEPNPGSNASSGWALTLDVCAVGPGRLWCKTTNRLYRVGRPAEVQGVDMPPSIRFPTNCKSLDFVQLDGLLAVIASMIRKVGRE